MSEHEDEQRGKRQLARRNEAIIGILIVMALLGVTNALEILTLLLPYSVGLSVALRGIDAHYNPKRL